MVENPFLFFETTGRNDGQITFYHIIHIGLIEIEWIQK